MPKMKSLRELYRIGYGPSSSHTMAPSSAAQRFKSQTPEAVSYSIILYGSLAATGKGHMTDKAISAVLAPKSAAFEWRPTEFLTYHANALRIAANDSNGEKIKETLYYSVGGGAIQEDGVVKETKDIYPNLGMTSLLEWCRRNGRHLWEFVLDKEDTDLPAYLTEVWVVMKDAVQRGLKMQRALPGGLNLGTPGLWLLSEEPAERSGISSVRPSLFVCSGRFRRERLMRQGCHGAHLRISRSPSFCPSIFGRIIGSRILGHRPSAGHRRYLREYREDPIDDFRCCRRLPGRSRHGLRDGGRGGNGTSRRNSTASGIRR
jgi:hypothetical protein